MEEAFQGTKRVLSYEDSRKIEAAIPPGVKTGSKIRLSGQGARGARNAGDLYLKVEVLPHSKFDRDGNDLRITQPVDLFTAMLGGEVKVSTIDREVKLTIPPETDSGTTFRLNGLGMPLLSDAKKRGDLKVTVEVQMPKNLSDAQKKKVEELQKALE